MSGVRFKAFLIFGPPGSGKGTVGSKLAHTTDLKHLSSGEIFRGLPRSSANGKLFYQYASSGKLFPDEVTAEIFSRYLSGLVDTNQLDPESSILLLDGIPRTALQTKLIEPFVDVLHMFDLEIADDDVIVQRLQHRAKIEKRPDDMDETVIRNRIVEYKSKTAAVLGCYDSAKITRINGAAAPDDVFYETLGAVIRVRRALGV